MYQLRVARAIIAVAVVSWLAQLAVHVAVQAGIREECSRVHQQRRNTQFAVFFFKIKNKNKNIISVWYATLKIQSEWAHVDTVFAPMRHVWCSRPGLSLFFLIVMRTLLLVVQKVEVMLLEHTLKVVVFFFSVGSQASPPFSVIPLSSPSPDC